MIAVAIKMLIKDPVKVLGIMFGMTLSTALITQQGGLFYGLMTRAQNAIAEAHDVDIWIMHPTTAQFNLAHPLADREIGRIRGVAGVAWAAPLFKANIAVAGTNGLSRSALLLGIDDVTLSAAPKRLYLGSLEDLKRPDAIAIDRVGFMKLWPNDPISPGKELELNDKRAVVVAITEAAPAFSAEVIIHTRKSQAINYVPTGKRATAFVVAGTQLGSDPQDVASRISRITGLTAKTSRAFSKATVDYYRKHTGIVINFATTIGLGVLVGIAIVGLTFSLFVLDNISNYAILKLLGVSNRRLVLIVLGQVGLIAFFGFIFGIGLATVFFELISSPTSALRGFYLPWWIPLMTLAIMTVSVLASATMGLWRVLSVDPEIVFRGQMR